MIIDAVETAVLYYYDTLESFLSKVAFERKLLKVNFRKWLMSHWKVRGESF